jgi:hypothetical protein
MCGPISSYSSLAMHADRKVDSDANIDAPSHSLYSSALTLHDGCSEVYSDHERTHPPVTRTFALLSLVPAVRLVSSSDMRSHRPGVDCSRTRHKHTPHEHANTRTHQAHATRRRPCRRCRETRAASPCRTCVSTRSPCCCAHFTTSAPATLITSYRCNPSQGARRRSGVAPDSSTQSCARCEACDHASAHNPQTDVHNVHIPQAHSYTNAITHQLSAADARRAEQRLLRSETCEAIATQQHAEETRHTTQSHLHAYVPAPNTAREAAALSGRRAPSTCAHTCERV